MDNLARNAMLARKAGMSYGQWKALQPNTREEREPIQKGRVCLHCGKIFIPKTNNNQKYCEFYCQNAAAQKRERERRMNNEN